MSINCDAISDDTNMHVSGVLGIVCVIPSTRSDGNHKHELGGVLCYQTISVLVGWAT